MTLKKVDHTFAYDALSYDAKPNEQPYIKLSFFFSKSDEVSYEHFHRHWQSIHSDLTIGTKAFKSNQIQRYVQVCAQPWVMPESIVLLTLSSCTHIPSLRN